MYKHELRWLNEIYAFYGGDRHEAADQLHQECKVMFERLKKRGVIYKKGGYKGGRGGWHVRVWEVSDELLWKKKYR